MAKPSRNALLVCTVSALALTSFSIALDAQETASAGVNRLEAARPLGQTISGSSALAQRVATSARSAVSLVAGDFYEDGTQSLITGYAVGEGGAIALQQGNAQTWTSSGAAISPFKEATTVTDAGIRPDFLFSADLNGDGHQDIVAAARGQQGFCVLLGDGRGNFKLQPELQTAGPVTAMATWHNGGQSLVAVAACASGCSVTLYSGDGTTFASVPLSNEPSVLMVSRVNNHAEEDLLVGGSAGLSVIDGQTIGSSGPRIERLPISNAVAATAGSFVYDHRSYPQIAVLTADGSVHVLARSGVASSPVTAAEVQAVRRGMTVHQARPYQNFAALPWTDVETLAGAASPTGRATPLLVRSRLSGSGGDDLIVLNANGGHVTTVAHPYVSTPHLGPSGATVLPHALPAVVRLESSTGSDVLSALALRVSPDARLGLITAEGLAEPSVARPNALGVPNTYTVNTNSDGTPSTASKSNCTNKAANCTLRSAIALVNSDAAANESNSTIDTINLQALTYTLTANNGAATDSFGSVNIHLDIDGPVNIIGGGASNTTISAGNADKVFSINSGVVNNISVFDVSMQALTVTSGTNTNAYGVGDFYGGLIDWESDGTGNLTFTNVSLTNGKQPVGQGGAIFGSNTPDTGNGTLTISGSTLSGNKSAGAGGAVLIGNPLPFAMTGSTVSGNMAAPSVSPTCGNNCGDVDGGGLYFDPDTNQTKQSTIGSSTFSTNSTATDSGNPTATGEGGAIYTDSGLAITSSSFTSNTAGTFGGGIYVFSQKFGNSITQSTFTGNTATKGGGIAIDQRSIGTQTVQYNRLVGNSATGGDSGLIDGVGNSSVAVTATDNFWGCNGPGAGTGCDTAGVGPGGNSANLVLSPYAAVTASLSSTTPTPGTTLTLTGSLNQDSLGASLGSGNLGAFAGLQAVLNISENGSTLASSTPALNANASSTLQGTPTAPTASSTSGVATVTVDNATATAYFTVTVQSPTISIAFSPTSVGLNGTSTLIFTLTNSNTNVALNGVAFSDTLPSGLTVAGTPSVSNTCSGTVTAAANSGTISFSGGTINQASNCAISVNVTATTAGNKSDTTGAVTATNESASGNTSNTATLTVKITPGLSLSAPATANRGTATLLTATFTTTSGSPAPTMQLSFYAGGMLLGSSTLSGSGTTYTATLSPSTLPSGPQSLTVQYPGDTAYSTATSLAQNTFVIANNIWLGNNNSTVSAYQAIGTPYLTTPESSGGTGVAIDSAGNVWSLNASGNSVAKFSNTGTVVSAGYTGGGISTPTNLAIDGAGQVWITNTNNSISVFSSTGTPVSTTAYTGGNLSTPTSISIDQSGNLWIANSGNGSVTEVLGAAAPTVAPLATGVANNTTGSKP